MRIQNGILMTMENGTFSNGYVDFENGIITGCGDLKDAPPYDGEILDAAGGYILPGLIDAHSHIGICEEGAGKSGSDCNESITPVTPDMRAMDGINPRDSAIIKSRKAGVTVAGVSPGSGNVICGQVAAVKLRGDNVREMVIKAPAAMKMAVGENPKRVYGEKGKSPKTRMAIAAILRKSLTNAKRYAEKKARGEDVYDPELEALIPVVNGVIPAHIHAHEADDIQTAIRIAQEFGLDYSVIHATGAKHVAAEMAAEGKVPVIGPASMWVGKMEMRDVSFELGAILNAAGVEVAITTDHDVRPLWLLPVYAALYVREGMPEDAALRGITINGAKALGIEHRVGSIRPGKDADIVVFNGHPFHYLTKPTAVFIDGVRY